MRVLRRFETTSPLDTLESVVDATDLVRLSQMLPEVHVEDAVASYLVRVVRATREHAAFELGASPRASLALFRAVRALAAIESRDYVRPDDVKRLAPAVLAHRLLLSSQSQLRGRAAAEVLDEILREVPVPLADSEGRAPSAAASDAAAASAPPNADGTPADISEWGRPGAPTT